jgi:chemotaxis protein methyltransferase CheR
VRNFYRSLVSSGWFLVSAVETLPQFSSHFVPARFEGATLYRKRNEFDVQPVEPLTSGTAFIVPDITHDCEEQNTLAPLRALEPDAALMQAPQADAAAIDNYTAALELFERGNYAAAAELLKADAVAAAPAVQRATLLARIYANLGELAEAREWAERAVAADRTNAVSHYLRAVILQEQSRIDEASEALQKTLYLEPTFVLAHFALATLVQRQGRPAAAARHFANALALLRRYDDNDVLPHSDGMAAGRLKQMIQSISPVAGVA